jgi:NADH:ubiquinone reductase (non-electrogenic)
MAPYGICSVLYQRSFEMLSFNHEKRKNIVVIGYGWGGKSFVDTINKQKYNVTVISKDNKMLNTTKIKNSIIDSLDDKLFIKSNYYVNHIEDECIDFNKNNKTITTKNNTISYDYLVVAVGSETNDFNIPGVKENCYFLKSVEDLHKLRDAVQNTSKNLVILGGGPAGIELAFQLSKKFSNIKIVEAMSTILPMFNESTINIVKNELLKSNITLELDNKVNKIDSNTIYTNKNNINYDLSIWTCGIKSNSLIKNLTDNKLVVDSNFKFSDSIFAIGDIVASKELGPPTGQNAKQQGRHLAYYFNNDFEGKPYKYEEQGKIIHTKNWIVVETKYGSYRLPYFIEPIIDYFILEH